MVAWADAVKGADMTLYKDRPPHSQVLATRTEAGVTLDFPSAEDEQLRARQQAWRTFEFGVLLLVGSVIWYAWCIAAAWHDFAWTAVAPFLAGILALLSANSQSWAVLSIYRGDDLGQLAVVGNLLVRTFRDHRKQIWYDHEIRAIALVKGNIEAPADNSEGQAYPATMPVLQLVVELHTDEKVILRGVGLGSVDERARAELEWILNVLRQALGRETAHAFAEPKLSEAIQILDHHSKETHITS